jgi:hypothetical protein
MHPHARYRGVISQTGAWCIRIETQNRSKTRTRGSKDATAFYGTGTTFQKNVMRCWMLMMGLTFEIGGYNRITATMLEHWCAQRLIRGIIASSEHKLLYHVSTSAETKSRTR